MADKAYDVINQSWKSTTKVLFGEPLGEMKDYYDYLKEPLVGKSVKSIISGKNIFVTSNHYPKEAKFFDYNDEITGATILSKPIDVNQIRDIDSLFEAVEEKFIYSGNKVLGNSKFVENSDNITDSNYVLDSSMIVNGKYIAYCYMLRNNDYCFASTSSGDSSMLVRCLYNNSLKRCFECSLTVSSSDCYFCHNANGSSDCMFTFNVHAKRNMIGNVQLSKEQYAALKAKLISEMAQDLKKKHRTVSIMDIIGEERGG
ncbi:Uncharacterised protein [Candidatus Bilamarchaeum dharawalense]|uniref:Uncharacterized protein n=1 Tax=Candidatus Bilamarchaeum dharawalense TaxID=2885759 RepID=A0A5E4LTG4_9ARCH|nr:Uncharacterised protein [Candidatus Bilamarchaeum dharawalense]